MGEALDLLKSRYPGAESFTLGDTAELSARLLALVAGGAKRATTGALRDFEDGAGLPVAGRRDIMLHWDGTPAFVIETMEVVQCRFDEITPEMALAEGEDADLAGWRAGHAEFFARNGGFDFAMPVVWERFEVVEECGN